MKSFLCKGKTPTVMWGSIPHGRFFEGDVPEGYKLALCPSKGMIVIDVDRHKDGNGFLNIPVHLGGELENTLNYFTKSGGKHYWFYYTGSQDLANKASYLSIDLRTHNGYVVWYAEGDIRDKLHLIQKTSKELNKWLESLFGYVV